MFDFRKLFERKPKDRVEVLHWSSNDLIRSCLRSLRGECTVADAPHQEAVSAAVFLAKQEDCWSEIGSVDELPDAWKTGKVFLLWDDAALPALRCTAATVLEQIEDVQAVSPEFCLISEEMERIVQFRNEKIRLYPNPPEDIG